MYNCCLIHLSLAVVVGKEVLWRTVLQRDLKDNEVISALTKEILTETIR